jgi:hypothetical protein
MGIEMILIPLLSVGLCILGVHSLRQSNELMDLKLEIEGLKETEYHRGRGDAKEDIIDLIREHFETYKDSEEYP